MKYFTISYFKRKVERFIKKNFPSYYRWLYCQKIYNYLTGKELNWSKPTDINQKLFWLSRFWQNPLIIDLSDKVKVRNYLSSLSLDFILTPIYKIYNNVDLINFDELPNQFILKLNHGSAMNIIVRDKNNINKREVIEKLNGWFNTRYGENIGEYHYGKIEKKIICEKLLNPNSEKSLIDYKLHCLNGKPAFFLVCSDREHEKNKVNLSSYDLNWNRKCYLVNEDEDLLKIERPAKLDDMISIAKKLSEPFPYVRVDFYFVDNMIYFSELTFTPAANIMHYYKQSTLDMMGDMLILPKQKIKYVW